MIDHNYYIGLRKQGFELKLIIEIHLEVLGLTLFAI